ncbi:unnamed protein product [Caenorhabditis angaria]|uniref:Glycosyltransferase family 92 protein n=1 Tax=Caenorhabditis angaria TaxID=860376 RepID=A0A9P1N7P9_9PELO|nr:unnamed protein product [Caenorhabditis angaria]
MRRGKLLLIICIVFIFIFIFNVIFIYRALRDRKIISEEDYENEESKERDDFKAFITSSYFYPKSKSLGDNALALVLTINQKKSINNWWNLQWWNIPKNPEIVVLSRNATSSSIVRTQYWKITPHEVCNMIAIFATVQIIPNPTSISLVGYNSLVDIPFEIPPSIERDVVVCISPLFISEQWQNFLFAVHIYKKFGAFMNLYLISAVDSFYYLMKEYENENYLTIQPWVSAKFVGVSPDIADPYNQIEFRNQAGSQTDCLLKYKETAKYVTFLDLDDVLIPRLAPTYLEEIIKIINNRRNIAFIHYHKENHEISTAKHGEQFSFEKMFSTLKYEGARETGKIVVDPKNLNYTWIHFPPFMPVQMRQIVVKENVITHLKNILWLEEINGNDELPKYYNNSEEHILEYDTISSIENDLQTMMKKPNISKLLSKLPTHHYYANLIGKCYFEKYYSLHYSGRIKEITCPGPQLCDYDQREDIKCIHVDADYPEVPKLKPVSYYFAKNRRFSKNIGCYPH